MKTNKTSITQELQDEIERISSEYKLKPITNASLYEIKSRISNLIASEFGTDFTKHVSVECTFDNDGIVSLTLNPITTPRGYEIIKSMWGNEE